MVEWRVFVPVPQSGSDDWIAPELQEPLLEELQELRAAWTAAANDCFSGNSTRRSDAYLAVDRGRTPAAAHPVGVKMRAGKKLEAKVCVEECAVPASLSDHVSSISEQSGGGWMS